MATQTLPPSTSWASAMSMISGTFYRHTPLFIGKKNIVSCRCSLKPIQGMFDPDVFCLSVFAHGETYVLELLPFTNEWWFIIIVHEWSCWIVIFQWLWITHKCLTHLREYDLPAINNHTHSIVTKRLCPPLILAAVGAQDERWNEKKPPTIEFVPVERVCCHQPRIVYQPTQKQRINQPKATSNH